MNEIETILNTITWPGSVALCAWVLYKVFPMYLNKSSGNGSSVTTGAFKDARIDELMAFKLEAESNHWHDIDDLKKGQIRIWEKLAEQGEDIVYIKGRINNINNT